MNKKGFTLIELLAVLVVLAILALIAIPMVIGIVNDAREKSYQRSIESYAKAFEQYIALDNIEHSSQGYDLLNNYKDKVDNFYSGNRVECLFSDRSNTDDNFSTLKQGKLVLRGCRVNNSSAQYKYEQSKVQKEKEYEAYDIGDIVTVGEEQFYVITKSSSRLDYATLLRFNPLTTQEVNTYGGVGTDHNHVNVYKDYPARGYAYNMNGYGGAVYYSSEECGYVNGTNVETNCTVDYDSSDVKYIVDSWVEAKFTTGELKEVNGYAARLIRIDELLDNFDYRESYSHEKRYEIVQGSPIPNWSCDSDNNKRYYYWTMDHTDDMKVWYVGDRSGIYQGTPTFVFNPGVIRPVINAYKDKIVRE